jgi:hypothetical protein
MTKAYHEVHQLRKTQNNSTEKRNLPMSFGEYLPRRITGLRFLYAPVLHAQHSFLQANISYAMSTLLRERKNYGNLG